MNLALAKKNKIQYSVHVNFLALAMVLEIYIEYLEIIKKKMFYLKKMNMENFKLFMFITRGINLP